MIHIKREYVIVIILVIAASGAGFLGGMKYQASKSPSFSTQFGSGENVMRSIANGNRGTSRGGFRPTQGEIISTDENSITVKLADGSSKVVVLTNKTTINEAKTVEKSEMTSGKKVMVIGNENSDGSITADSIQLNPIFRNSSDSGQMQPPSQVKP